MEEQIARGEFLEFGEYKGNLYGTSLESVKSIIRSGLTCIINPHYQVEFKIFVFITIFIVSTYLK